MANKWDERKKAQEEEYFVKKERELLAKIKAKQEDEAKEAAKKASYMKCPKCGDSLKERSFQKILIDQCVACHGILISTPHRCRGRPEPVLSQSKDACPPNGQPHRVARSARRREK
ncbi:MAG: zf-TFIIB domain-containing protein [Deltaproteobacteria bacterium]|nr:zf-TFIIB domain-containing protein [Deltaproteobacteria bacterium]